MAEQDTITTDNAGNLKVPFARLGAWVHPKYGLVKFSQNDFDCIKTNFANDEAGFEPYLTYGHLKNPNANDDLPSVGTLKEIVQEGDVLSGIFAPQNEEVVESLSSGEYRYSSAELYRKMVSKTTGQPIGPLLTAVALTNAPFVPNLPAAEVLSQTATDPDFFVLSMGEPDENPLDAIISPLKELVEMARNYFTAKKIEKVVDAQIEKIEGEKYQKIDEVYDAAHEAAKPAQQAADTAYKEANAASDAAYKTAREVQKKADEAWSEAYAKADDKIKDIREEANQAIAELEAIKQEAMLLSQSESNPETGEQLSTAAAEAAPGATPEATDAGTGTTPSETVTSGVVQEDNPKEGIDMEGLDKIQEQLTALSERLSVAEADVATAKTENADLKTQLEAAQTANADLTAKLSQTAETAGALASQLADKDLVAERDALVDEGVPPVMADVALSLARAFGEQKLSLGEDNETTGAKAVFDLLRKLPAENRVDLSQHGGAESVQTGNEVDLYGSVVESRFGRK